LSCCLFFEPLTARGVNITETGGQHHRNIQHVGEDVFITNKEAKNTLKSIFTDLCIKSEKPTVTLLNKSGWFNVKKTQKRISGKQIDGIKLSKAA